MRPTKGLPIPVSGLWWTPCCYLLRTRNLVQGKIKKIQGVFDNYFRHCTSHDEKVASLGLDALDLRIADFIQSPGGKADSTSTRGESGRIRR